jgi:hypothetical protein
MAREERWGVSRAKVAFQPTEGGVRDERTAKRGVRTAVQRGSGCGARREQVECQPIASEVRGVGTGVSRAVTAMSRDRRWGARRVEWAASESDCAVTRGEVVSQSIAGGVQGDRTKLCADVSGATIAASCSNVTAALPDAGRLPLTVFPRSRPP